MKGRSVFSIVVSLAVLGIASVSVLAQGRESSTNQETSPGRSQQLTRCVSFGGNGWHPIYPDRTLRQYLFSMNNEDTAFVEKQEGNLLFISQYEGVNFITDPSRADSFNGNQSPLGTSNPRRGWVEARGLDDLSEPKCRRLRELASIPEPAVCNQPQTQRQISNCAGATYKQAHFQLNKVYEQVISKLNERDQEKLSKEQSEWNSNLYQACKNRVKSTNKIDETASIFTTYFTNCLEIGARLRTAELEKYLQK